MTTPIPGSVSITAEELHRVLRDMPGQDAREILGTLADLGYASVRKHEVNHLLYHHEELFYMEGTHGSRPCWYARVHLSETSKEGRARIVPFRSVTRTASSLSASEQLHRALYPVIRELILAESARLGRPVDRDDVGPQLQVHPETADLLLQHYRSVPRTRDFDWYCRNKVDWYSAKWTSLEQGDLSDEEEELVRAACQGVRRLEPGEGQKYWLYEGDTSA